MSENPEKSKRKYRARMPAPGQGEPWPEMLTTHEVAEMLRVHPNTVRKWYNKGFLKGYRVGPRGDRRFLRQDLERIIGLQGLQGLQEQL